MKNIYELLKEVEIELQKDNIVSIKRQNQKLRSALENYTNDEKLILKMDYYDYLRVLEYKKMLEPLQPKDSTKSKQLTLN